MTFAIAVASLKADTGKTTRAIWLARAFAEAGCSVLLADANPAVTALQWAGRRAAARSGSPAWPLRVCPPRSPPWPALPMW
jgi:cellulose biosynthesis protein BcsQ